MASPQIRFTQYDAASVAEVVDDLAHLDGIAGSVVGTPPAWGTADLATHLREGIPLQVTTGAVAARLAGYVAGHVTVEQFIDAAGTPWADVVIPRDASALAHLMAEGWDPVPQQAAEPASSGSSTPAVVVLSGASAS